MQPVYLYIILILNLCRFVVLPAILLVMVFMVPRALTVDIVDGKCLSDSRLYDQMLYAMTLPALLFVVAGVVAIVVCLAKRHEVRNTAEAKCHYQV